MNLFDSRAARVLLTALAFAVCLAFVWIAWRTLIAFLFAIFFAYLLEDVVGYFARHFKKNGRVKGIAITYLVIFGSLAVLLAIFGAHITQEVQRLSQQLPGLSEKLSNGQLVHVVGVRRGWSFERERQIQSFLNSHQEQIIARVNTLSRQAFTSVEKMWWLLVVPILAIFFLKDGARFGQEFIQSFDSPRNKRVISILVTEIGEMLGHFMRAQVVLTVLAMGVVTLALVVLRVPYGYALGPIAGALEFVPVIGPLVGGAIVLSVAFLANYTHLFWILVILIIWRCVQDYVTAPRIMGGKLELHPLAVLFGVLAGAELAGVIGVFLSVPALAAIRIIVRTYRQSRRELTQAVVATDPVQTGEMIPPTFAGSGR